MNHLSKLKRHQEKIDGLGQGSRSSQEFNLWRKETEETLAILFGEDSAEVREFNAIYYTPVFLTCRMGDEAFDEAFRNGLEEARGFLSELLCRQSSGGNRQDLSQADSRQACPEAASPPVMRTEKGRS